MDFFNQCEMDKQRQWFSIVYLYKFVDLHRMVSKDHKELLNDFKPYIKKFKESKRVLRNNNLSKVQRLMMETLPYFPKVSYMLYDNLIR